MMHYFSGATMLAAWVSALFFYRFWRKTHDSFFAFFSAAFFLLGVERIILAAVNYGGEHRPYAYVIRLCAFIILLAAIFQKNRSEQPMSSFTEYEA